LEGKRQREKKCRGGRDEVFFFQHRHEWGVWSSFMGKRTSICALRVGTDQGNVQGGGKSPTGESSQGLVNLLRNRHRGERETGGIRRKKQFRVENEQGLR